MKATIILTDEQISQLTKVETEFILKQKNKAIEEIEKKFENDLSKLIKKYKTFTIDINVDDNEETSQKFIPLKSLKVSKLSDETISTYFNEGKSIKEMCELTGRTDAQIRAKLNRLNLKIRDRK